MKLKIYERRQSQVHARPSLVQMINANRKGGYFCLNIKAIELFGLEPGYRIVVANDEDSRNDWYLTFGKDLEIGTKLRVMPRGNKINSMRTQNKEAVNAILNSVKAENGATFLLSKSPKLIDGRAWYKILTAKPIRIR